MSEPLFPPVGIERLCVFGMPPVEFIRLAEALECPTVGLGLTPHRAYNPHGYPDWSLRDDPALRRETRATLQASGVALALMEGFGVGPGAEADRQAADLDTVAELGGRRINAASMERDAGRAAEGFAALAEQAAQRGIETVIEIGPGAARTLAAAVELIGRTGRPDVRLLVDAMHFFRFGSQVGELHAVAPALIGYLQLCDAPVRSVFPSYMDEALHDRLAPGEGELPLADLIAAIPPEVVISVEVPQRALAEAGVGPRDRVARSVTAARRLIAEVRGAAVQSPLSLA